MEFCIQFLRASVLERLLLLGSSSNLSSSLGLSGFVLVFGFFFCGLYFCLFIKMGISSDGSRSKGADKRLPDIWRAGCKDAGKGVGMLMMMMPQFNAPYEISFRFGTNWILLFGSSLPGCGCRRGLSTRRYTRLKEPT